MKKDERKIEIFNLINENKSVSVEKLSRKFKVSTSTIRRILQEMENSKLIQRKHGGACSLEVNNYNITYDCKCMKNYIEKDKIARMAASLVEDNDYIMMGSSSITYIMANYLTQNNISVVTNSLNIANVIKNKKNCQLILLGGYYFNVSQSIEGIHSSNQIKNMHFNKVFLGADGIDYQFGVSTVTEIELNIKKTSLQNCDQSFFLCENKKFNIKAPNKVIDLSRVDTIIVDDKITDDDFIKYSEKCKLLVAK